MARRIIDLTFPIHQGMTTFPVHYHPAVEVVQLGRHEVEHRETRKITLGTHTGTHCDAPRHFIPGGDTVESIPPEVLVGPAFVCDFTGLAGPEVDVADFEKALAHNPPDRIVLRFDWSDHWDKPDYYTAHPYLSEGAARWLADRGVRLLAMDTPQADDPRKGRNSACDSPNHLLLLGRGLVLVESLCALRRLARSQIELIVAPLKVVEGDGAPARCFAIEDY